VKAATPESLKRVGTPRLLTTRFTFRNCLPSRSALGFLCITASLIASTAFAQVQPALQGQAAQARPLAATTPADPRFEVFGDYGKGNQIAQHLRNAQPRLYEFDRASLRDVLRFLADDAGIPFVALPEDAAQNQQVTFTMRAAPFRVLETISKANGVALFFENGVWFMRPFNDQQLIGRTYHLKFNPQDQVTYEGGDTNTSGASTGTTGGAGGLPELNVNIQGGGNVFETEENPLLEDIEALLGIPTTGFTAPIQPEVSVGGFPAMDLFPNEIDPTSIQPPTAGEGDNGARVIYNSETNTLYVIATRQQHQWVEAYLKSTDVPQDLIGIEVKFVETTRDSQQDLGINWANTFGEGYPVGLGPLATGLNWTGFIDGTEFWQPVTSLLSIGSADFLIDVWGEDADFEITQYPRVLTLNNKEVAIRSVINQPVLASTSSVTQGVAATEVQSVSYLPIGTILNILPKVIGDRSVVLNTAITVSTLLDFENIQGVDYPITASRVYNASLQVDNGYTVAIGGLTQANDAGSENGILGIKEIPLLGYLFKTKGRNREQRDLLIFITPSIKKTEDWTQGLPEQPVSVVNQTGPDGPKPPTFTPTGRLVGGLPALNGAIAWLSERLEYYSNLVDQQLVDGDTLDRLRDVISTSELIRNEVTLYRAENPDFAMNLDRDAQRIDEITVMLEETYKRAKGVAIKDIKFP